MARDPWTDPQLGDEDLEFVEAGSGVKLTIIAGYTRGPDGRIDRWWKPGEEPPD